MSFARYESYKDSGVEWLGEVPEHWETVPIKHLGRLKGGAGFPHNEQGVEGEELSFHKVNALSQAGSSGVLLPSENTITRDTAAQLGAFVFPPKSIIFAKVGAALLLGRIRILGEDACIDNNMMGLIVTQFKHVVGFVRYAMSLVRFDLIANPGAVPSLNEAQIGNFLLALPTSEEQTAIAAFLDRETAKIDALIAEQQRLIELLKEKRQAVISHAVTKGLNPDAPMKDSGIEWLGEVPEHWSVVPLKWFARCASGDSIPSDSIEPSNDENSILVIGGNGVMGYTNQVNITYPVLVIGRVGALCGNVHFIQQPVWVTDNALILDASPEAFDLLYLAEVLRSRNLNNIASTTAQPLITGTQVRDQRVPRPTLTEQSTIATFIDNETAKLDALTAEAKTAITLLQERRTALISAAVTGKIDVRGQVAAQPEREAAA